ncbi:MAG: M48 family metalloprotease [Mariprofundus sp.]
MKFRYLPVITALLTMTLSACATNPATKDSDFVMMSESQELKLGQQAAAEINKSITLLDKNDPLVRYVDSIGQKVAKTSDRPELFYRFHVVDDATINAFALPGGYIYMHRGLINHMNSEAELAAVLGHEIGHVTARHSVKQYSKMQAYQIGAAITSIFLPVPQAAGMLSDLIATAVLQGYGREAELQSDELSLKYLTAAGYDPNATVGILKTLKRLDELDSKERTDAGEKVEKYHGAFSSHPKTEQRILQAAAEASSTQAGRGITNRNAILHAVNGYPYADSPEQGAVVGRRFLHPDLGIQLEFPDDWVITNTPAALNARLRQKEVYFQLQLKELRKRQTATEVLRGIFPERHTNIIKTGTQDGMSFVQAEIRMSAPHVSYAKIDARVFLRKHQAFVLLMWSERDDFINQMRAFSSIAQSFRGYDGERDGDIPRIALHRWQAGDSWQKLAAKSGQMLGRFSAEKLAALNGMDISERPKNGNMVKTVR